MLFLLFLFIFLLVFICNCSDETNRQGFTLSPLVFLNKWKAAGELSFDLTQEVAAGSGQLKPSAALVYRNMFGRGSQGATAANAFKVFIFHFLFFLMLHLTALKRVGSEKWGSELELPTVP